ncbi:MAG: hypothetical protein NC131_01520 [Roseburia sp.]|nr:hypothetical protein [Roseburia sp.]
MIDANDKDVEIIAESSRKTAYIFLALSVLGVLIAAAGIIIFIACGFKLVDAGMQAVTISLTAGGGVILIIFTVLFIKQLYRPYSLITLSEGKVCFAGGKVCSPNEIEAVEKSGQKGRSGTLTVTVNGEKLIICGVVNFERAYRKLAMLAGKPAED